MATKWFKKDYVATSDYPAYTGYGVWNPGDAVNWHTPQDGSYTVTFITEQQYLDGVAGAVIPISKEQHISQKLRSIAIDALIDDGILDSDGNLI